MKFYTGRKHIWDTRARSQPPALLRCWAIQANARQVRVSDRQTNVIISIRKQKDSAIALRRWFNDIYTIRWSAEPTRYAILLHCTWLHLNQWDWSMLVGRKTVLSKWSLKFRYKFCFCSLVMFKSSKFKIIPRERKHLHESLNASELHRCEQNFMTTVFWWSADSVDRLPPAPLMTRLHDSGAGYKYSKLWATRGHLNVTSGASGVAAAPCALHPTPSPQRPSQLSEWRCCVPSYRFQLLWGKSNIR